MLFIMATSLGKGKVIRRPNTTVIAKKYNNSSKTTLNLQFGRSPRTISTSTPEGRGIGPRVNTRFNTATPRRTKSGPIPSITSSLQKLTLHNSRIPSTRLSTSSSKETHLTLTQIAQRILKKQYQNIVVMAGAGISTPSGIADFRSPGTGLYDNLQKYKIPFPEAIFDINYLEHDPRPFFTLCQELYPGNKYQPNYVHYFVRLLHEKGLLLRMYTQNIDGLERLSGIPESKLIEAHGTFSKAACIRCGNSYAPEIVKKKIFSGQIPRCHKGTCSGIIKPEIVFFGEDLPKRFYSYHKDFRQCDLLIVMGTSLEVFPFAGIIDSVRPYTARLLINGQAVGPFVNSKRFTDSKEIGDIVEIIKRFVQILGWKKIMEELINSCKAQQLDMEDSKETTQEWVTTRNSEMLKSPNEAWEDQDKTKDQNGNDNSSSPKSQTNNMRESHRGCQSSSSEDDTKSSSSVSTISLGSGGTKPPLHRTYVTQTFSSFKSNKIDGDSTMNQFSSNYHQPLATNDTVKIKLPQIFQHNKPTASYVTCDSSSSTDCSDSTDDSSDLSSTDSSDS